MSDHRLETFTREASQDVVPPDFDALVATAKHRRRANVAGSAVAVAAVMSALKVGVQQLYDDQASPLVPVNPPSVAATTPGSTEPSPPDLAPTTEQLGATAEQVVNHPDAMLTQLAVSPHNPDVRAAIWRHCVVDGCSSEERAMTVTDDGFATSHYIALPPVAYPSITALGGDAFFYTHGRRISQALYADGRREDVTITDKEEPVDTDEVLVTEFYTQPVQHLALNLSTLVAHPVPHSRARCRDQG